jgi:hypothetical protein
MADELLQLSGEVDEAIRWLSSACERAGSLCTDDKGAPVGWRAAEQVADQLGKVLVMLRGAMAPLRPAIEEAQKHQDHMEDLWDATRL